MEIRIEVNPATGAATGTVCGEVRLEDLMAGAERLWSHAGFGGSLVLWDLRGARFSLSSTDVAQGAAFVKAGSVLKPPARMGFVVSEDLEYGLVRMFGAFREEPGIEVRTFRDLAGARDWLESSESPFSGK